MAYKDKEKQKEFQRVWSRKKREKARLIAIEILGGKCVTCGYNENHRALQIDHIDPILRGREDSKWTTKVYFEIASGRLSTENLQLLCANCHAIKTFEDRFNFSNYIS